MISFDEALRIVFASAPGLPSERVPLALAVHRVLAEPVHADLDMPPFNKSAMDGYACRKADLGCAMGVIEELPAGVAPKHHVGPGQCAKIMTGAMVPEGAECVIMVEYTEAGPDGSIRFTGQSTKDNICLRGEDMRCGDVVLPAGTLIRPEHVAVLAAVGCAEPCVARSPHVGVVATGDELVSFNDCPGRSQIRNTNSPQLIAQLRSMGCEGQDFGIAPDTLDRLVDTIGQAVVDSDVVLLSGGVSMGEYDLVPEALRTLGFEIAFDRVAVKPGKPTTFFSDGKTFCFGLPGNPVSTYILFELMVKPFLYRMQGHEPQSSRVVLPAAKEIKRRSGDREAWLPAAITQAGGVQPLEYHGSAHSGSLCGAQGLIRFPVGVACLPQGTPVDFRLLPSS